MPRTYKHKSKSYTELSLEMALSEMEAGASVRETAKKYNVSRTILNKRMEVKAGVAQLKARGRKPLLGQEIEDCLGVCIRKMEQLGFGPTLEEMRSIVHEYVVQNEIKTPWGDQLPGKDWCSGFMERQRLSLKKSGLMQIARKSVTSDPYVIYGFYEMLKAEVDRLGLADRPECVWNCDESGFPDDPSKCKTVGAKGAKTVRVTCGNNRANTTVLAVCSAKGKALDPLIVFKGVNLQSTWKGTQALPDTWYSCSKSGWMTTTIFHRWFTLFTEKIMERPLLLLFDGHMTHMSIPTIQLAMEENISLCKFPAHCTDTMQPLDVCGFAPLKTNYEQELTRHVVSTGAREPLTKSKFADMVCKVWHKGLTEENIQSGFESTGVFPVNSWKYKRDRLDSVKLKSYNWWKSNGSPVDEEGAPDYTGYAVSPCKMRPNDSFLDKEIGANSTRLDETSSQASVSANVTVNSPASVAASGTVPVNSPASAAASGTVSVNSPASAAASSATVPTVSGISPELFRELQSCAPEGMRYVLTLEPVSKEISFEEIIKGRGRPSSTAQPKKRRKMSMYGAIITEPEYARQLEEKEAEEREKEKKKQERLKAKSKAKKPVRTQKQKQAKCKAKPNKLSWKSPKIARFSSSSESSGESSADGIDDAEAHNSGEGSGEEQSDASDSPAQSSAGAQTLKKIMQLCRKSLDDDSG